MKFSKAAEFFDLSQDLFCIVGEDGYIKKANRSFCLSVGYCSDELVSIPCKSFIHEDDLFIFLSLFEAQQDDLTVKVSRFKCANGSCKWFSWRGTRFDEDRCIYLSVKDISQQRELEEQLKAAIQVNERILNSSLDLICSLDMQGNFASVSKASESLLGYSVEEMTGRPCTDFLCPEDFEITGKAAVDMLDGMELTNFENRYIHKNGRIIPITWSARWSATDQMYYCVARKCNRKEKAGAEHHNKRATF
jgi:PAS domain S-box-containing protein